jgi:hypothetical protein
MPEKTTRGDEKCGDRRAWPALRAGRPRFHFPFALPQPFRHGEARSDGGPLRRTARARAEHLFFYGQKDLIDMFPRDAGLRRSFNPGEGRELPRRAGAARLREQA